MTDQEKKVKEMADELIHDFFMEIPQIGTIVSVNGMKFDDWDRTKHLNDTRNFALIAVKHIINALPKLVTATGYGCAMFENPDIDFWNEVKVEIETREIL
jgi:hypothetical protein